MNPNVSDTALYFAAEEHINRLENIVTPNVASRLQTMDKCDKMVDEIDAVFNIFKQKN